MQYNGVPVGGAKVAYRVTREVRYPDWFFEYCWWRPIPQRPAQEIANGIVQTELDGSFTIPFAGEAGPVGEPEGRAGVPLHDHRRRDRHHRRDAHRHEVRAGRLRRTRARRSNADDWLTVEKAVKFDLKTTTLDGEGQAAKGTLKVFALKQPEKPARGDILGTPYYWWPRRSRRTKTPKPDPAQAD